MLLVCVAIFIPAFMLRLRRGARFDVEPIAKGLAGELAVERALSPLKASGYQILGDLQTGFGNVDIVVIGPTGVFAIEVKNWRGAFYLGRGGRLMHGGRPCEEVVTQARREAMAVRDRLRDVPEAQWVEALVVSAGVPVRRPIDQGNVTVLGVGDVVEFIVTNRRRLSPLDVARATAAILRGNHPVTVRPITPEASFPSVRSDAPSP